MINRLVPKRHNQLKVSICSCINAMQHYVVIVLCQCTKVHCATSLTTQEYNSKEIKLPEMLVKSMQESKLMCYYMRSPLPRCLPAIALKISCSFAHRNRLTAINAVD